MKRLNLLSILLFLMAVSVSSQTTFYKKYSYAGKNYGNSVIQTFDGGYAIVGTSQITEDQGFNVILIKTDANGDKLWEKSYGDDMEDQGYCIAQTSDGGYIIGGSRESSGTYRDGWIFKTDEYGAMQWSYIFGSDLNGEAATGVAKADNNTFIFSGNNSSRSYAIKIGEQGNVFWERTYFGNNNSGTADICALDDGTFAIVGSFQNSAGGGWYPNIFVIDADGNDLYQLTYSDEGSFSFVELLSNNCIVYGGSDEGLNTVYKLNYSTGAYLWTYKFPTEYLRNTSGATETSDNNLVVVDNAFYASMRKLNTETGDTLWTRSNTMGVEYPYYSDVISTSDNALVMTGYNDSYEIILVKTMESGSMTSISEIESHIQKVILKQNAPNPFTESTSIKIKVTQRSDIKLFISDENGNIIQSLVDEILPSGEYNFTWNGRNINGSKCPAGVYNLVLQTDNIQQSRKMLKVK